MEFVAIGLISLFAAGLTLFSGFGLGTILTPVFALLLPIEVAVAATAVVHLANNLFKCALVGKWADRDVVLRFGLPGVPAAFLGAWLLLALAGVPEWIRYDIAGREAVVTPVKVAIAALIAVFAVFEMLPGRNTRRLDPRWLPLGGMISGLVGGLSGHQGAVRSAFLIRTDIDPQRFVGTNTVIAVIVDLARLAVYGFGILGATWVSADRDRVVALSSVAMICAFCGSLIGSKLVKKVTLAGLRRFVAAMLIVLAIALGAGII